jgi:glucosamine-6-phosphate deaminase
MRTGPAATTVVTESSPTEASPPSPTILSPQPVTSRLLRPTAPASEYPVRSRSASPELVPDRMADRVTGGAEFIRRRLTPNPEEASGKQQQQQQQQQQKATKRNMVNGGGPVVKSR